MKRTPVIGNIQIQSANRIWACGGKQCSHLSKLEALNNFRTHITFKYNSILKLVIVFILLLFCLPQRSPHWIESGVHAFRLSKRFSLIIQRKSLQLWVMLRKASEVWGFYLDTPLVSIYWFCPHLSKSKNMLTMYVKVLFLLNCG